MPQDNRRRGPKRYADLEKIGSLWLKTSSEGKKYQSGVIGIVNSDEDIVLHKGDKIMIFPNKHRQHENSPWYYLFREKPEEQDEEEMPFGAREEEDTTPPPGDEDKDKDDDIPF